MVATQQKPNVKRAQQLRHASEEMQRTLQTSGVDRDRAIVYGVKVLGLQSQNVARTIGYMPDEVGEAADREYSYAIEAIVEALPKYEGATVVVKHTEFQRNSNGSREPVMRERSPMEAIGTIRNCRVIESGPVEKQGLYADLYLHKSDPLTVKILDDVEFNVGAYKLSHEAYVNKPSIVAGRVRIGAIYSVDCIALITGKAGTVRSLIESADEGSRMKIRAVLEKCAASAKFPQVKTVLEEMGADPMLGMDTELAMPEEGGGELEATTKEALGQVWMAIWNDDTLDKAGKLAKARMLLGFVDKAAEPAVVAAVDTAGAAEPETMAEEGSRKPAPLDAKIVLESVAILREAGHHADEEILEAMALLPNAEKRRAFVGRLPKPVVESAAPAAPAIPTGPARQPIPLARGNTPKPAAESTAKNLPTGEELARMMRAG